ncbi:MAG TPA: DUF2177 family protein [Rhizomicrobium sp.]|nr:DUF2177 family protein [Rhizomicrobium sp.]HWC62923.1 DUF2177 family protein [Rhizomicrobium sp.]
MSAITRILAAYGATLVVLLALDLIWLRFAGDMFFRPNVGSVLTDKPNIAAAALFYLFFSGGLIFFAVMPAAKNDSAATALLHGALLGFLAYMTFDLTSLAILKGWSVKVSLIDISWGTFVSGVAAGAGFYAFGKF